MFFILSLSLSFFFLAEVSIKNVHLQMIETLNLKLLSPLE